MDNNKKLINKLKKIRRKHGKFQEAAIKGKCEFLAGFHGGIYQGITISIRHLEGKVK